MLDSKIIWAFKRWIERIYWSTYKWQWKSNIERQNRFINNRYWICKDDFQWWKIRSILWKSQL